MSIKKIFTGAGYNLTWSFKKNMFAVISYCDDSKETYDVDAETLNNAASKAKLVDSGIKSVIVIYRIEKEKLRKVYIHDEYRCLHLYDQSPVLNVWYNKTLFESFQKQENNIDSTVNSKAMWLLSWTSQSFLTEPINAPESMLWSQDCKYCIMWYDEYLGVYSLDTQFRLIKKHYVRANHCKLFGDFFFIVTDESIFFTITTMDDAQLYEIANSRMTTVDPNTLQEMTGEESKHVASEDSQVWVKPPWALKILALWRNILILQLYNGDLKCIQIKNDIVNFVFRLKTSEAEQKSALKYFEQNPNKQNVLFPFIKWAKLDSKLNVMPASLTQDQNYTQWLKFVEVMKVLSKVNQKKVEQAE